MLGDNFYLFFIKQIYAKVEQKIARIEANTSLLPTQKQYMHIPTTEHVNLYIYI